MFGRIQLLTCFFFSVVVALATVADASGSPSQDPAQDVADVFVQSDLVLWSPHGDAASFRLSVAGPDGVTHVTFPAGEKPALKLYDAGGEPLEDGSYAWRLEARPIVAPEIADLLAEARQSGDEQAVADLEKAGLVPRGQQQFGHLTIAQGRFVLPDVEEADAEETPAPKASASHGHAQSPASGGREGFTKDFTIYDDLIVKGSTCLGHDCVVGEDFGYNTLRLKENNLQIEFDDTSGGFFPKNDWQLVANEPMNGGADKFSLVDVTHSRTPFTIEAAAPSKALFVNRRGDVGFRTNTPEAELHVVSGNSPGLRLEQTGSSGFAPQTWEVEANESNFFVQDVTNRNAIPLRIRPGGPSNSLTIDAQGNIGHDTYDPDTDLHVVGGVVISDVDRDRATHHALEIQATYDQQAKMLFDDGDPWAVGGGKENRFIIQELTDSAEFVLEASGDLTIAGTLTESSDRHAKEDFSSVDASEILDRVRAMPITTWSYKADTAKSRHIGPMAQDFFAAFGFGASDKGLAPRDVAGVALAAIQGLTAELELGRAQIRTQAEVIERLEARLAALETKVP